MAGGSAQDGGAGWACIRAVSGVGTGAGPGPCGALAPAGAPRAAPGQTGGAAGLSTR